ncbi:hypothetical protein ACHAPT_004123 [Fusarium lateritium]
MPVNIIAIFIVAPLRQIMNSTKNIPSAEASGSSSPESRTANDNTSNDNTPTPTIETSESDTDPMNSDEETDTDMIEGPCSHKHTTPWLKPGLVTVTPRGKVVLDPGAERQLRRHTLERQACVHKQISNGRANLSQTWCGDPSCEKEKQLFEKPNLYLVNNKECEDGYPVKDYFYDLVDAMVLARFPGLQKTEDKARKSFEILSFIDSPPIRLAFWRMKFSCNNWRIRPNDEEFEKTLLQALPVLLDLMFNIKTAERVEKVHKYIGATLPDMAGWNLQDFILRFLLSAEIWRQHKTPRRETWIMGSRETVGEFLAAVLTIYHKMWARGCLTTESTPMEECWDEIWKGWLEVYPAPKLLKENDRDEFQLRERLHQTEEDVLEQVGYLGGIGKGEGKYALRRGMPGE